jgi:hypothetical protein
LRPIHHYHRPTDHARSCSDRTCQSVQAHLMPSNCIRALLRSTILPPVW